MNRNQETEKAVLICGRCSRITHRLLTAPVRPESSRRPESEGGLVCEHCLLDLERERLQDEAEKMPPAGQTPTDYGSD